MPIEAHPWTMGWPCDCLLAWLFVGLRFTGETGCLRRAFCMDADAVKSGDVKRYRVPKGPSKRPCPASVSSVGPATALYALSNT